VFDVAVLRTTGTIQVIAGTVLFVPTICLSAGLGFLVMAPVSGFDWEKAQTTAKTNFLDSFDVFMREPAESAWLRPLGTW
jgi:hypothetical protein